ncbi:MAG: hypothetical protein JJU00_00900 [Opitutales bacterium]|nr:hypothetical protein [Opitutales bacterium]
MTLIPPLHAQLPEVHVHETAAEFVVTADFTGNGLADTVIVDRTSGAYRLGRQTSFAIVSWEEPRATGIGAVTGASAGRVQATGRHSLVVTAPEANRIHVIDVANTASSPQAAYATGRTGPHSIATGQLDGTGALEDFAIATMLNDGGAPYSLGFYENLGGGNLALPGPGYITDSTELIDRLQRVALSTAPAHSSTLGFLEMSGMESCLMVVSLNEAGLPHRLNVCGLPVDVRYGLVRFGGSSVGTLLTYVPGDSFFTRRSLSPAGTDFVADPPQDFAAPFPLGSLAAVTGDGTVRLALLSADGMEVAVFEFDGLSLGALAQTIAAPSASAPITAVVPAGDGEGMLVLRGGDAPGHSAGADFYRWNSGTGEFVVESSADFPSIAPRAGMANVTLMSGEPFVDAAARPITLRNARDWTSGPPPTIPGAVEVTAEIFASESTGLTDPQVLNLGLSDPGTSFALLNQYSDPISIFTLSRAGGAVVGQVSIEPQPGLYDRSIELRFNANPGSLTIRFRDAGGAWQTYADPGPEPDPSDAVYPAWFSQFAALVRFSETTIEYYGENAAGETTPIRRAHFRFTEPPETLSTLDDGVPDYAKLGLGVNPFRLPDGDANVGVGNALQAILAGGSVPPRWLSGSAVDVYVRPLSHDGDSNPLTPSRLATDPPETLPDGTVYGGNQIFARTLSGAPAGQGRDPIPATPERNEGLGIYAPFAEPSAYLANLSGEATGVFVVSTRPGYALAGPLPDDPAPSSVGRELIGLLSLAGIEHPVYTHTYSGGSLAVEAAAWKAGAEAFYSAQPPPVVTETLDATETLAALLFERWLQARFVERGLLAGDYALTSPDAGSPPAFNTDYLTLTPYRTREGARPMTLATEGAVSAVQDALRAVTRWDDTHGAYNLAVAAATVRDFARNSPSAGAEALRTVARDVYRISAAHGNELPGALEPPVDVLRRFIATGGLPEPYTPGFSDLAGAPFTALAPAVYADAVAGIVAATDLPAPRATDSLQVEFRADSLDYPGCLVVQEASLPGVLYSLFNRDGRAFRLPASFEMLPGTRLFVHVFTDTPFTACAGSALEVIEVAGAAVPQVQVLPTGSGSDADGNLLGDEWEKAFFGDTGVDPWEDAAGDGYTYLQKYLDGKDPFLPMSYADEPAASLQLPVLHIDNSNPSLVVVSFDFPEPYASMLDFQVFEDPTLSGDWMPAPYTVTSPVSGSFEVSIPLGGGPGSFWQIGMSLP